VRFETERPTSWQACLTCGNELTETDPHSRCPVCGGLLEIHHRPPDLTRDELIGRFTERRGREPTAPPSGVWRFREIVLPGARQIVSRATPRCCIATHSTAGLEHNGCC
jgi:DNA-directed RNA polymerase subunit RPC12/RpoP